MKNFINEFKAFILRGNVVDMAVGVVVGNSFKNISTSLVNDVIMPAIGMLLGKVNFAELKIVLQEAVVAADGTELNAATSVLEKDVVTNLKLEVISLLRASISPD